MVMLVKTLSPKKDAGMQCHTQASNITTHIKVEVEFTLPTINATNVVMRKYHVDESAKEICDMI